MHSGITIKMGAAHQSLIAGDVTIDLSSIGKEDRYETRKTLIETLKRQGYFPKRMLSKTSKRRRRPSREKTEV